jgi:hypothetical protein
MPAYVCVAIDSADDHHDLKASGPGELEALELRIPNTLAGFLAMDAALRERFGAVPRHYAMENPRLLLGRYLLQLGANLHAINPHAVAHQRRALATSGRKDDRLDAQAIHVLLCQRVQEAKAPLQSSSPEGTILAGLVAHRVDMVEEKNRVTNQLTAVLKGFYPRALELFSRLDQPVTLTFLEHFASPAELQAANEETWAQCFEGQRYPRPQRIGQLLLQAQATQVEVSPADQYLGALQVRRLVRVLQVLLTELTRIEQDIEQRFEALPAAKTFRSLPGAADVLAPALFAVFGDHKERWTHWKEVARQSGAVPVTKASGRFRLVHMRHSCDHRARRTLHLLAACSRRACTWAEEFYQAQRKHGKTHGTALRNLAVKWLRILYRLWQDDLTYDESTYLKNLSERQAPRRSLT